MSIVKQNLRVRGRSLFAGLNFGKKCNRGVAATSRYTKAVKIGVLALQGNYEAHAKVLQRLGHQVVLVRNEAHLSDLDGLVIPGGESTVMSRLCDRYALWEPLQKLVDCGLPMLGTCAGMILLAREIRGGAETFPQKTLGALDICVLRNAYGAQLESFETDIEVPLLDTSVRGVFIRAPRVAALGAGIEVLAQHRGVPVIVRRDNIWAVAFHPEICDEDRVHALWLSGFDKPAKGNIREMTSPERKSLA